ERQKRIIIDKLLQRFGDLQGKNVAVLGLAFKPNTDDMREAPSILITNELIERGASVSAFDPVATVNAKKILPEAIDYATTIDEAIRDKDVRSEEHTSELQSRFDLVCRRLIAKNN